MNNKKQQCDSETCGWSGTHWHETYGSTEVIEHPAYSLPARTEIPGGTEPTLGRKFDSAKLRWSLLPWGPLETVVELLELGARKYAPDNWKYVPDAEARYLDAMTRHMVEIQKGNHIDPETQLPHLAAVVANALFALWFQMKKEDVVKK